MTSRRVFLKNGTLALVSLGFAPKFVAEAAAVAQARKKILVAVFQRGAVDGLNMVVPHGEPAYYQSRPTIAIARPHERDGAVDLDGFFGLHPRMAPLKPLFDRRELAIVHASGSHDETRSHFDAQDYMESGTPGVKSTRDGWLNRYLHAREHEQDTPFRAVALAAQLPRTLQGTAPALAIGQLSQFGVRAGSATEMMSASFESQYASAADAVLQPTGREAFEAVKQMQSANPARYSPAHGAEYPRSGFGEAMKQVARSPSSASGTTMRTKAAQRDRSPIVSTTSRAAWPRFPRISVSAWRTSSWSPCPSSAGPSARTAAAVPTTVTAMPCSSWEAQ
jgi:uncharacterized protein (DUF1501 family)